VQWSFVGKALYLNGLLFNNIAKICNIASIIANGFFRPTGIGAPTSILK